MNDHIRLMKIEDLEMVRSWRNHPNIKRYMFSTKDISATEHENWFNQVNKEKNRTLLIYTKNNKPLGFVQFAPIKTIDTVLDWGFYAAPDASKGTGTTMSTLALDYAFNQLKAHKIFGEVLEHNIGSINFHLKMGFIQEGVLRDHHYNENVYSSIYCFGLMHHEWIIKRNELPKHQ